MALLKPIGGGSGFSGKSGFSGYSGFSGDSPCAGTYTLTVLDGTIAGTYNLQSNGSSSWAYSGTLNGHPLTITLAHQGNSNWQIDANYNSGACTTQAIADPSTCPPTGASDGIVWEITGDSCSTFDFLVTNSLTGSSGFSGYSGSGFSGYSGAGLSGFSGYSGKSGFSGYSGSGFSGYSGATGAGTSGFSGYSGPSGFSGYSGPSGFSGYSGKSGFSGYSGPSGFSGYSGPSGFSGYSGPSGFSGYSGKSGFSGYSAVLTAPVSLTANYAGSLVSFSNTATWTGFQYSLDISGYTNLGGFRMNGADGGASVYLSGSNMTFAVDNTYSFAFSIIGGGGQKFQIGGDGYIYMAAPTSAPGNFTAGTISFYLDESGNNLKISCRYSNGSTLKIGTVALV